MIPSLRADPGSGPRIKGWVRDERCLEQAVAAVILGSAEMV
jgi:hypothetical protein